MAVKYKLQDLPKLSGRMIFVDANVLIHLFWLTGANFWEQKYASVFARLLQQGNPLFVDFLIISEVINRMMRIEHNNRQPNSTYKAFRDSQDGEKALSNIYLIVKEHILKRVKVVGKIFERKDIEAFLVVNELDFVDKSTVNICKENNFVLLTNDRDFANADIDLLTCNPYILNS